MLANNVVHGDLSAYNILYWQGDIRIIDFPQAVNPYKNPNAYRIFERDVERICQYLRAVWHRHAAGAAGARPVEAGAWRRAF